MSRGLAAAFKTALGAGVIYPAYFAEFQFDSGTTRFWSGTDNISADLGDGAVTWTGGALIGGVQTSGEAEDIQARKMTFTLNAVDRAYYATAIATKYRGRPVKLWFALTGSDFTTVSYYYLLEEVRIDKLSINDEGETITLTLECESRLVDLFTARRVPMTNEELQKTPAYATHTFYEYIPTLIGKKMPWGLEAGTSATPATGYRGQSILKSNP